jgi:hypothetical protein
MSGRKGRSGRKGYIEEKEISELLKMSLATIRKVLLSDKIPLLKRAQLAAEFVKRRITNKQEIEGSGLATTNIIVKKYYNHFLKAEKVVRANISDQAKTENSAL